MVFNIGCVKTTFFLVFVLLLRFDKENFDPFFSLFSCNFNTIDGFFCMFDNIEGELFSKSPLIEAEFGSEISSCTIGEMNSGFSSTCDVNLIEEKYFSTEFFGVDIIFLVVY